MGRKKRKRRRIRKKTQQVSIKLTFTIIKIIKGISKSTFFFSFRK
jgi:hypothetical protein